MDELGSEVADAEFGPLLQSLEVERRLLEARVCAVVAAAQQRVAYAEDGYSSAASWCRGLTGWSTAETTHVQRSISLLHDASIVADALLSGSLGVAQLRELARAYANPRCGKELTDMLPLLLSHAPRLSFYEFRTVVRRWESLADSDGAFGDSERANARRTASVTEHDGVVSLNARVSGVQGAEMLEVFRRFCDAEFRSDCEAMRQQWGDEACPRLMPRSDAQRRLDALHQIFVRGASAAPDGAVGDPLVNIVVDLSTFEWGFGGDRPRPADPRWWRCETTGGMRLPVDEVLAAALVGQVRRVVFDSAGIVVDMGRKRQLFTGALRDAVMLAANGCVWAGCSVGSANCEADHTDDWQHGGVTATRNGGPLCGRHNRYKRTGFRVQRDVDGYWHTYRPDGTEIRAPDP